MLRDGWKPNICIVDLATVSLIVTATIEKYKSLNDCHNLIFSTPNLFIAALIKTEVSRVRAVKNIPKGMVKKNKKRRVEGPTSSWK